ncbi:conserved hypothetical protein [gamma proteobacterium HTCC5015]|nr:conserved hypothetical protein [gamma proteobacterium HTCC5015]
MYEPIKIVHALFGSLVGLAIVSRLLLLATDAPLLNRKPLVLTFMGIDVATFLLGVALALQLPELANANGWLHAKVVAWLALFGSVFYGIKVAQVKSRRILWVSIGLMIYLYIMALAHSKQPWPF